MSKKYSLGSILFGAAVLGTAAYGAYKLMNSDKFKEFFNLKQEEEPDAADFWCEDDTPDGEAVQAEAYEEEPAEPASEEE